MTQLVPTSQNKNLLLVANTSNIIANPAFVKSNLPEILFITSYPPTECGIATYSNDLVNALNNKFSNTYTFTICALEKNETELTYTSDVKYVLHTKQLEQYKQLAALLNADENLSLIYLQHEFGLFSGEHGVAVLQLLSRLTKPVITTFHTVLPQPNSKLQKLVSAISRYSKSIIVMTKNAADILRNAYHIEADKINVIAHGTHLVSAAIHHTINGNNQFADRVVLSTFGLLSAGKSIETALDALPQIIKVYPNVIYLIIGKTHPDVVKLDGEVYRTILQNKVIENNLQAHVLFINKYLSLGALLNYLQRTDIYLFTSKDPNQAVSGTLAYALGCGCPVIATPIPHAKELLDGTGVQVDFQDYQQLADAAISCISNPSLLQKMHLNALHRISPSAWQNVAIAHAELTKKNSVHKTHLQFNIPKISLAHIRNLTTNLAMIQFSEISTPDLLSGYTLDDNARALIAVIKYYDTTRNPSELALIDLYFNFVLSCQQKDGSFLNYMDIDGTFALRNRYENLEDSNGRAIWALGELLSYRHILPLEYIDKAAAAISQAIDHVEQFQSPRAMAFVIKGLYHYNRHSESALIENLVTKLADNLVSKYRGVSDKEWKWYEAYLTYANSLLPEAMLYAAMVTGNELFKSIAKSTFDFLLQHIFKANQIKVISNNGWQQKGMPANQFGEQPIDIAYTILGLDLFYQTFNEKSYLQKMFTAFNWFLGKNHLHQIIYNPCTGGCYDGLEETHINLNQGAESTVSYLLARLTIEKYMGDNTTIVSKHAVNASALIAN
jgi:glycosyltransferase involved in cell wall biosynthesis